MKSGSRERRSLAFGILFATALQTGRADAERLTWHDSWRRVGPLEYATTLTLLGGYYAMRWLVPPSGEAAWSRPVLMDAATRRLLMQRTRSGRDRADAFSDGINYGLIAHNLAVDALAVAWIEAGSEDVAWQLFVIDMQSYAASLFLNTTTKRIVARGRPYVNDCEKDPDYAGECGDKARYRAFYSMHAALSATSAGLVCAHHTQLALYGGGAADLVACGAAAALSLTAGSLRIASDNHWTTDVLVGWLLGAAAGYVLPTLAYYDGPRSTPREASAAQALGTAPQFFWAARW